MKRLITLIIFAMMLVPAAAHAQIQVTRKDKSEKIVSLRSGYVSLSCTNNIYYLSLRSDNQFDDPYVVRLGEGKEVATSSLNSLIEIADTIGKGDHMDFSDGAREYSLMRGAFKSELWMKGEWHAGYGKTSSGELKKVLKALEKHEPTTN